MSTGLRLRKHLAWRSVFHPLVRPLLIKEKTPRAYAATCLGNRAIRLDEHLLVFQAAPQPFNEDVVKKSAFAVHADPHTATFQLIEKRGAGELHALIRVEHVRLTEARHRL